MEPEVGHGTTEVYACHIPSVRSWLHIAMLSLIPLQFFFAIAIPNMVGAKDPHVLGIPLFLLPAFVLLIWASWPLMWVGLSWLIRTNSIKGVTLAAQAAHKRAVREGAVLKDLVSAMRWSLYGVYVNGFMVVLALATIFVLLNQEAMHASGAPAHSVEIALEMAAALLILVWPILSLYFFWRRRRQSGAFVRELRNEQSQQLLEADASAV